jgi:hypothetical protein
LPFFRASDSAIAIACFRLFTLPPLPPGPLLAVPWLKRRISLSTSLPTLGEYFRFVAIYFSYILEVMDRLDRSGSDFIARACFKPRALALFSGGVKSPNVRNIR